MTIEPPLTLHRSPVGTAEKMCPEGVAFPTTPFITIPQQVPHNPSKSTMIRRGSAQQPETPEQYIQDPAFAVASPSSVLMYEQDVSDMQKSLLSPCSNHGTLTDSMNNKKSGHITSGPTEFMDDSRFNIDDLEKSCNLETIMNDLASGYQMEPKLEPQWNPPILDTGQTKFKAEDVMMSQNVNQGPTLAQLNEMDSSFFDDINSIITNDSVCVPKVEKDSVNSCTTSSVSSTSMTKSLPVPSSGINLVRNLPSVASERKTQDLTTTVTSSVTGNSIQPNRERNQPTMPTHVNGIENILKNRLSNMVPTIPRFTTCTITSPVQEIPVLATSIKAEPLSPTNIYATQPVLNIIHPTNNQFVQPTTCLSTASAVSPSNPYCSVPLAPQLFLQTPLSTLDKPSLQKLLAPPVPTIKQEPMTLQETSPVRQIYEKKSSPEITKTVPSASGGKPPTVNRQMATIGQTGGDPGSPDSSGSTSSFNNKWEEIKRYLETKEGSSQQSDEPAAKKIKSEQTDVAYNPVDDVLSRDQDFNSDSDSDLDADLSDTESIGSHSSFVEELLVGGKKEKRYFWQYNTQAKGPKGKRLCKSVETHDPHILNNFEDPVFDPDINDARYKHNGRARKGDGNDITPNPYKLFQIGNQLKKLNRKIHDIAPPGEVSNPTRSKTRREKNKFASRACRLKKKAQHEANKIKLYGLDTEHAQLIRVLDLIKTEVIRRVNTEAKDNESLTSKLDRLMKSHLSVMIAGNTPDYVNSILEHVVNGDKTGGLKLH